MTEETISKGLDAANKSLDLATKIYDDGLSKPVQVLGNGLSMCLSFIGATVSPAIYGYIQNAEYKKQEIDKKLKLKYEKIPEDNRIEPRMSILGPSVDLLKYNLDEQHIKDIFVNLLTNEMNKEKQDKVLPSYIEIAKQLSVLDAHYLKSLYDLYKSKQKMQFALDIIIGKYITTPEGYIDIDKVIIGSAKSNNGITSLHTIKLNQIVVDNLSRLELMKVYEDKKLLDDEIYEIGFNSLKRSYDNNNEIEIYLEKGIVELTEYGLNFLEICFE